METDIGAAQQKIHQAVLCPLIGQRALREGPEHRGYEPSLQNK